MTSLYEPAVASLQSAPPTGQVLKGQYARAYRSDKGKIKGLLLLAGETEYTIKLPKYLRPMLLRELVPGEFVQVWAYAEDEHWRAINVMPLPECEAETLRQQWGSRSPSPSSVIEAQPKQKRLCIEVCSKGKCFKQGGRKIYDELQDAVDGNPELAHVSVKATGCMNACKQGPNLRLPSGQMLHRATPAEALARLDKNR